MCLLQGHASTLTLGLHIAKPTIDHHQANNIHLQVRFSIKDFQDTSRWG